MKPEEVSQLEIYLQKQFNLPSIEIRQTPDDEKAEVFLGQVPFGDLLRDDDEGELSYVFEQSFRLKREEALTVQKHLRMRFNNDKLELRKRPQSDGSSEVYIGSEFIAVLYREEIEDDHSYHIAMSILDIDLEDI